MNITTIILILALLSPIVQNTKVQCQHQPNNWIPGKSFILSDREELVSTIYGVDVIVDRLDQTVSHVIKESGTWEPHYLRTMARFVKEGDTVVNIGSHIGLEAIVLGKIAGPKGKLFILEPFSVSNNMVRKNVFLNQLGSITTIYKKGASNKYSKGFISVDTINTGGSSIFTDQTIAKPQVKTEEVQVDLVDNILPKDAIIDFALIDVQHLEVECLEGMKQIITRSPNIVIEVEWAGNSYNTRDIKQKIKALLDWFSSLNFKFYRLFKERPKNCANQLFKELTTEYILSMPDPEDIGAPDLFFLPVHIDPNRVF